MDPSQRTWTPTMRRRTKARNATEIAAIRSTVDDTPGFFKTSRSTTSSALSSNVHSNGPNVFISCIRLAKTCQKKITKSFSLTTRWKAKACIMTWKFAEDGRRRNLQNGNGHERGEIRANVPPWPRAEWRSVSARSSRR
jgi:hypothetical protein